MIEWKIAIDSNPKSKTTSSRTYQHDNVQLQIYELFYLGFAQHNLLIFDCEIPLKSFRLPSVVDLYVATCFHKFLIVDLVSVDVC